MNNEYWVFPFMKEKQISKHDTFEIWQPFDRSVRGHYVNQPLTTNVQTMTCARSTHPSYKQLGLMIILRNASPTSSFQKNSRETRWMAWTSGQLIRINHSGIYTTKSVIEIAAIAAVEIIIERQVGSTMQPRV